jgi:hypothetical protein
MHQQQKVRNLRRSSSKSRERPTYPGIVDSRHYVMASAIRQKGKLLFSFLGCVRCPTLQSFLHEKTNTFCLRSALADTCWINLCNQLLPLQASIGKTLTTLKLFSFSTFSITEIMRSTKDQSLNRSPGSIRFD